jgi:hypothetical protein
MRRVIAIAAIATLAIAACGSDDDGGGSGGDSVQDQAADQAIAEAAGEDIQLDEDCVRDVAGELSDEDAQAIIDAGPDGDAELSEAGEALSSQLFNCIGTDDLANLFIDGMKESGQDVDEDCVREQIGELDPSVLAEAGDEPPAEVVTALMECVSLGG